MSEEQKQPTAKEISEPQQPAAQAMESQVTSQTPATRPAKNPKRVAAGKMVAEKNRLARETHKQKADMYDKLMAKESAPAPSPAPAPEPETEPKPAAADSNGLTTNQLISIIGIGATLLTTYVKRDDIKAFFGKEKASPPEPAPQPQPVEPQPVEPQPRKGIRKMD